MKLKFYKITNIIWLASYIVGCVVIAFLLFNQPLYLTIIEIACLVGLFGVGITGFKKQKETKNDFIFSLVAGILYLMLFIPSLFVLRGRGAFAVAIPLAAVIATIPELLATTLAIIKTTGHLFKGKGNHVQNIEEISKESMYFLAYLTALVTVIVCGVLYFLNFTNPGYGYYFSAAYKAVYNSFQYIRLGLCGLSAIFLICSFVWLMMNKQNKKLGMIFTIGGLSSLFYICFVNLGRVFVVPIVMVSLIIGTTLIHKGGDIISFKKSTNAILGILSALSLLIYVAHIYSIYQTNMAYDDSQNMPFLYRFFESAVIYSSESTDYYVRDILHNGRPSLFAVFLSGLLIFFIVNKKGNKKLMMGLAMSIFVAFLLCGIDKTVDYLIRYAGLLGNPYYYGYGRVILKDYGYGNLFCLITYFITAFVGLAAFICFRKQKPIEVANSGEQVLNEENSNDGKIVTIIDISKMPALGIASYLFLFLFPIISDAFDCHNTFFGIASTIFNFGSPIGISDPILAFAMEWILIATITITTLFILFSLWSFRTKHKLVELFEYIICAVDILIYGFFIILVVVSNSVYGTSFYTLAAVPLVFFIVWFIGLVIFNNRKKVVSIIDKQKTRISIKKQEEAKRRQDKEEERRLAKLETERIKEEKRKAREAELERKKILEENERALKEESNQSAKKGYSSSGDKIHQLQELAKLKESGVITEEEFLELKKEIIGGEK